MSRRNLPFWRQKMLISARDWAAADATYPSMVGTIRAIVDFPDLSASQKLARIRVLLDAADQVRAELSDPSIPQQGGVDHDM